MCRPIVYTGKWSLTESEGIAEFGHSSALGLVGNVALVVGSGLEAGVAEQAPSDNARFGSRVCLSTTENWVHVSVSQHATRNSKRPKGAKLGVRKRTFRLDL